MKGLSGIDLKRASFKNDELMLDIKDRIDIGERELLSIVARLRDVETRLRLGGKNVRCKKIRMPYKVKEESNWFLSCLSDIEVEDPPNGVDFFLSGLESFFERHMHEELTDADVKARYGRRARYVEILMSNSLLYLMTAYMKSWSPARIKKYKSRWFRSLCNLPLLGPIYVVKENGKEYYLSTNISKREVQSIRIKRKEINVSGYACAYSLFKKIIQTEEPLSYEEAIGFGLNYDRLKTLLYFGLVELVDNKGRKISKIGKKYDLSNTTINSQPAREKFVESKKEFGAWLLESMLNVDPRLRRFVLGLNTMDRSDCRLMTYQPALKSNNILSRWFALNHFAVDNLVRLCTNASLINVYTPREGEFRPFFSCFVDFLADLETATIALQRFERAKAVKYITRHRVRNGEKAERLIRHLTVLGLAPEKFSFSRAIHETRKKKGIVINLIDGMGPEESVKINPWAVAVINWPKLDKATLSGELEKYATGEFHYIPKLRFDICRKLGVSLRDFDEIILEIFREPPENLELSFRIAEQALTHKSHSPIMIDNLPHLLVVMTKRKR